MHLGLWMACLFFISLGVLNGKGDLLEGCG